MSNMVRLSFSISINADVSKVWYAMLGDRGYRQRTSAFNPAGSRYVGDWTTGSNMRFMGPDPQNPEHIGGMYSEILSAQKFEHIYIRHLGMIEGDTIDMNPDGDFYGAIENYTFHMIDGVTTVEVETDMTPEYVDYMSQARPKGLAILKDISENKVANITVSTVISADIDTVRTSFTDPAHIIQRNFASEDWHCPSATNNLIVGGYFSYRMAARDASFAFDMSGRYDKIIEHSYISYTMGEMKEFFLPAGRVVEIFFQDIGDGQVRIVQNFDTEDIHDLPMQEDGRSAILQNFKKYTENLYISSK